MADDDAWTKKLPEPVTRWTSALGNKLGRLEIKDTHETTQRNLYKLRALDKFGNHICADCGYPDTSWASVVHGVFICALCARAHQTVENSVGPHVTKVKGCSISYYWGPDEIDRLLNQGNYRSEIEFGSRKVSPDASKEDRIEFVIRKYQDKAFVGEISDAAAGAIQLPPEDLDPPASDGGPTREQCLKDLAEFAELEPVALAEHVDTFAPWMQHSSASVRRTTLETLAKLESADLEPFAEDLAVLLHEEAGFVLASKQKHAISVVSEQNWTVRWAGVLTLGHLEPSVLANYVGILVQRLRDEQQLVRRAALEGLANLEPTDLMKHVSAIHPVLADAVADVRRTAVLTLGHLRADDLLTQTDVLLPLAKDQDASVRRSVAIVFSSHQMVVQEHRWTQSGFDFWEAQKKAKAEKAGRDAVAAKQAADDVFDENEVYEAAEAAALSLPFEQPAVESVITDQQYEWLAELEDYLYRKPADILKRMLKQGRLLVKDVLSVHALAEIDLVPDSHPGVRTEAVRAIHKVVPAMLQEHIDNMVRRMAAALHHDARTHHHRGIQRFKEAQRLHLKYLEMQRICAETWEDIDAPEVAARLMDWSGSLVEAIEFILTGINFVDPDDRKPLFLLFEVAEFNLEQKTFKNTLDGYLRSIGRL